MTRRLILYSLIITLIAALASEAGTKHYRKPHRKYLSPIIATVSEGKTTWVSPRLKENAKKNADFQKDYAERKSERAASLAHRGRPEHAEKTTVKQGDNAVATTQPAGSGMSASTSGTTVGTLSAEKAAAKQRMDDLYTQYQYVNFDYHLCKSASPETSDFERFSMLSAQREELSTAIWEASKAYDAAN